ncbi:hypothetical protein [Campylobacter sp.]|uniref:hypothetical protein n=1 Tax=Campylobacter sp. TaxID=205 RepID=UPI0027086FE9|nr:hypothetical protein [Campylobacter sp.]
MSIVKIIGSMAAALFLAGCAQSNAALSAASLNQVEPAWTNYLENDASLQKIAFYSANLAATKDLRDGAVIGFALTKGERNGKIQNIKIGDMYASGGKSFTVVDLDRGGYYINMHDKNEILSLKNSKNIKFYEFGGGILETVVYSTSQDKTVCDSFLSGKEIDARSVTNYYDASTSDNSKFFATLMSAKIIKDNAPKASGLEFKYFVGEADLVKFKEAAESDKFKKEVIDQDLIKQERVLKNIICSQFLK